MNFYTVLKSKCRHNLVHSNRRKKLAKVPDKAQYIPLYSPQMKVFEVACELVRFFTLSAAS